MTQTYPMPLMPLLLLAASASQAVMGLACWVLLSRRHPSRRLLLWSLSALGTSAWIALVALRGQVPDWASYALAQALAMGAMLLVHQSLRLECGEAPSHRRALGWWLALSGGYALLTTLDDWLPRFSYSLVVLIACNLVNARVAARAGLAMRSPSGRWLARLMRLWAALLALRLLGAWFFAQTEPLLAPTGANMALLVASFIIAMVSHLAYMGMVLDHLRGRQAAAVAAQAEERTRREGAEQHAGQLRQALTQLDAMAREREQLLDVLAHEIRQPLHRATGALLSAGAVLRNPQAGADVPLITERLHAAETVLGELRSVLDNTLAAAQILTRRESVTLQDVDLDLLLQLVLGDLAADQRQRVHIARHTRLRTLEVEPGLVRLALRNLLNNAFAHGDHGQATIELRVEESAQPYGMALSVCDQGAGLTPQQWAHLDDPATRHKPIPRRRGQGMGLSVVRQIMGLHGGELRLRPGDPCGLQATLIFPWPDERKQSREP